jgi:hypothetical protein
MMFDMYVSDAIIWVWQYEMRENKELQGVGVKR